MTPIEGVLFDIDDTLVDTHAAFDHALRAVTGHYLPPADEERAREVLDHWRADPGGYYRAYTRGELGYQAQRMARVNAMHSTFGGPELDGDAYEAWNAVFEGAFREGWRAHDDAARAVARLRSAGLAVGALSNAAVDYQTRKVAAAGLDVPVLVGVDTLGVGKPDPRVFAEACRRLGTAPERTAYVGDEPDIDARAAVEAGLVGIWLDRGQRAVPAEDAAAARAAGAKVIASLDELVGIFSL